jgi:hypothetical protein
MAETVRKSKRIKQPPLYLCDDYHILTIGSTQDEDVSPMDAEAVVDDHLRDPPVKQRRGRPLKVINDPLSTTNRPSTCLLLPSYGSLHTCNGNIIRSVLVQETTTINNHFLCFFFLLTFPIES